jgi:ArsR family transcriptional regulator
MTDIQTTLEPAKLQKAAAVLKTLGHPVRIAIIDALERGELNVTEIQETINEPQAITSQHLRLMEERDILKSRKDGVQVFYSLRDKFIQQILGCIKQCGIS